jgi:hypothetical protein
MNDTQRPHVFITLSEWECVDKLLQQASLQLPRRSSDFLIMFALWRKLQVTRNSKRFVLEVENQ